MAPIRTGRRPELTIPDLAGYGPSSPVAGIGQANGSQFFIVDLLNADTYRSRAGPTGPGGLVGRRKDRPVGYWPHPIYDQETP